MKILSSIITILLISISTFAFSANNSDIGEIVRYKGVFYEVVYSGLDYTVLINQKTSARKIVEYKAK
jgi:hypothetical protein